MSEEKKIREVWYKKNILWYAGLAACDGAYHHLCGCIYGNFTG